ncbi:MAG: DoxX family membrane protein [Desulfuromusa sp.]|nr:DoxX family membrane protein [Desulfuromusa sp.]
MTLLGKTVYHVSRLGLAAVFIYAGVVKANDTVAFAGQIANYQILPYAWNYLVASILPYIELLCGILLLLNMRVRPAILVLFLLNIIFMFALSSAIIRGFDIDCGCFKPDSANPTSPLAALWRDAGLLLLMIVTWFLRDARHPAEAD